MQILYMFFEQKNKEKTQRPFFLCFHSFGSDRFVTSLIMLNITELTSQYNSKIVFNII